MCDILSVGVRLINYIVLLSKKQLKYILQIILR